MTQTVTREKADQVLVAVKQRYPGADGAYGPELVKDWQYLNDPTPWAIVWEDGPFEWAYTALSGGVDEEVAALAAEFTDTAQRQVIDRVSQVEPIQVDGVFLEPVTSWAIGIYPED